ncbi:MAG: phosphatase PAP2 family protein [Chloroflexi bacterium]|nr:phosphatase PAP2 family protein [Chloroflexota bacterium]
MPTASRTPSTPLLAAAGVAAVLVLAVLVSIDLTDAFDRSIIEALRSDVLREVLGPLRFVTELASTGAVTAVAVVALLFGVAIGPWRHGLAGTLTILLASLANGGLKLLIARARPDLLEPVIVEHGFSFPSGHSALGMVAYGVLAVLVGRSRLPARARVALIFALGVLVGLIGISRIWLGVHYPTDVLAGWTAGGVIVLVYAALTRRVSPEPAAVAVDADPAAQRSVPPAAG